MEERKVQSLVTGALFVPSLKVKMVQQPVAMNMSLIIPNDRVAQSWLQ